MGLDLDSKIKQESSGLAQKRKKNPKSAKTKVNSTGLESAPESTPQADKSSTKHKNAEQPKREKKVRGRKANTSDKSTRQSFISSLFGSKGVNDSRSEKTHAKAKKSKKSDLAEDEEILASDILLAEDSGSTDVTEADNTNVQLSQPFENGFVNVAFKDAVNIHWQKSPEAELLLLAMTESLVIDGFYVGSIYAKASFAQKTGGGMLL